MSRLLVVLTFLLSGAAFAQDFDYNFVQASYGQFELDDVDVDGDGFGIGGSVAVSEHFHLFGGYSTGDFDFGVDMSELSAGLGYNAPLSDTVDLIASVAYVSVEVDVPGFGSADENGYGLGLGLRAMATPAVELNGGLSYVDLGDESDGDTSFGAGFLYHFSESFAAGASGNWGDDMSSYQLNGRFSFGN
ncbi:MAG: outer membrane beta-barrel protein [Woeseia sp.]